MKDGDEEGPVNKTNIERITNGIFAFTMTLLIRNLAVPDTATLTGEALAYAVVKYALDIAVYLFVFLVLAIGWVMIFRVYRNIVAVDLGFVTRVFAALLFVVFLPVTSQLDVAIDSPIGGIFSQINLGLLGIMTWLLFRYAVRHPALRNPRLKDPKILRSMNREYLVMPGLSAIALVFSGLNVVPAGFVYLAAPLLLWFLMGRDGLDR